MGVAGAAEGALVTLTEPAGATDVGLGEATLAVAAATAAEGMTNAVEDAGRGAAATMLVLRIKGAGLMGSCLRVGSYGEGGCVSIEI